MKPILPGSTIGVLGSGQLGRMFTIAARQMGYRVHTFSPDQDTPTGQVADLEVRASYDDLDAVASFSKNVSVVTFEFENVPAPTAETAARWAPVRPSGEILHVTQQRMREKRFLTQAGLPLTPYREVPSFEALAPALEELGCPAMLKSAAFGYDGKGQFLIEKVDQAKAAWDAIGAQMAVLEAFIDFEREISVVAARGVDGKFVHYGAIENRHSNRILDVSSSPAVIDSRRSAEAVEIARVVLERLDVIGVLCVEFFVARSGALMINELAPRPHNSGHFTIDACATSQFEQQLRAVCGLPLGSTEQYRPAAMANLLGELWANGEPNWTGACGMPEVKLHLYGKLEPRLGRKMGHLTAIGAEPLGAAALASEARARLRS